MFTGKNRAECAKAIQFFHGNVDRACEMIFDG